MKKTLLFIPLLCLACFGCSHCCHDKGSCCAVQTQAQADTPDWEITTKVKAEILSDTRISVKAHFVSVNTTHGVVTLTGSVPTKKDRALIVKMTQKVKGVVRVDNRITVSKT